MRVGGETRGRGMIELVRGLVC